MQAAVKLFPVPTGPYSNSPWFFLYMSWNLSAYFFAISNTFLFSSLTSYLSNVTSRYFLSIMDASFSRLILRICSSYSSCLFFSSSSFDSHLHTHLTTWVLSPNLTRNCFLLPHFPQYTSPSSPM